ncbi:MAG TPA: EAL domain-containing protein [Gammaproteobacteria bacterium]|nr:EAL domain-containing protein [Gammaproteobacteria bacterium]
MNWFYNLSIKMKLLAAFSIILVIVVGLSVFSVVKMHAINAASTEIVTNWLPSARFIANIRSDLLNFRSAELQRLRVTTPAERQGLEQDMAKAQASMLKNQHRYEPLITTAEEGRLYREFVSALEGYQGENAARMTELNGAPETYDLYDAKFNSAIKSLAALTELNVAEADAVSARANNIYAQSSRWVFAAAGLSILMVIALSAVMYKRIGRPVRRLARVAGKISMGDLGARTRLNYERDELGELAQAFDEMAKTLQRRKQEAEQATRELRNSEERLQLVAKASNDAIWDLDLVTEDLVWNENFATMFGYRQEDIEPGMASWNNRVHPEDKERVLTSIHNLIASGGPYWSEEYRFRRSDGSYAYLLDRGYLVHDDSGKPVRMIGSMVDLTERKQIELTLSKKYDELQAIYRLTDAVNQAGSVEDVYQEALNTLQDTLHADRVSILLFDEQGIMRFVAWRGLSEHYRRAAGGHIPWSAGDATAQPILVADAEQEPSLETFRETLKGEGIRALAFIPILHQKRLLGKFMVYYNLPHAFSREEIQLAQTVASHIAFAIERAQQTAKLEHQALYDSLTDIPNRTLLHDRLRQAIIAAQRSGASLALLLIDLDRFKEINDTLGHDRGDQVLKQIGPRIQGVLRLSDTVARLGGDEFAVLLPTVSNPDHAVLTAGKILQALQTPFPVEGLELEIGASIGIVLCPEHGTEADLLMQHADVAMYLAKQQGGGYAVYASELDQHSPQKLTLMSELRHAIEHDELVLYYQPKLSLKTQSIIGVEALVRWRHPQRGLIYPDQFIPLAEQTGLIKPLSLWVIDHALRQHIAWRRLGLTIGVAVNLSARNLHDQELPRQIAELLRLHQIKPHMLDIEITESAIMADPVRALEVLTRLSDMGVKLSIDDFGTGYSSLAYLKKLPVDAVKIDKSFVMDMAKDADNAMIVRSTIDLAHNLGVQVIAEGVEVHEAWIELSILGCDAAQGYYINRPIPAAEFITWLNGSPWELARTVPA